MSRRTKKTEKFSVSSVYVYAITKITNHTAVVVVNNAPWIDLAPPDTWTDNNNTPNEVEMARQEQPRSRPTRREEEGAATCDTAAVKKCTDQ